MEEKNKGGRPPKAEIDEIDKQIIRLKLANRKLSMADIGKILPKPMSKQAVSNRMKKTAFANAWNMLEMDVMDQLKELQFKAVKVMKQTLESNDQKLRYYAARDLLHRTLVDSDGLLPDRVEDTILEFID